jgi:hypothetical protein
MDGTFDETARVSEPEGAATARVGSSGMGRREFVGLMSALLGSALSPACSRMLLSEVPVEGSPAESRPLMPSERAILETASELVIPRTDTPGALDAGVPDFIEMMLSDWYRTGEREDFLAGLRDLDRRSREEAGVNFVSADEGIQLAILSALEVNATESVRAPLLLRRKPAETFVLALKELTLIGYCTSKEGATQLLQWEAVPGRFDACAPFSSTGRASAGW